MRYDDARLERALAALPLEDPPAGLRDRILLSTIHRTVPIFLTWELAVVGCALAVCTWLILAIIGSPADFGAQVRVATSHAIDVFISALNPSLLIWFAIGGLAALVLPFSETALTALRREKP
jgi:hypothetical protein